MRYIKLFEDFNPLRPIEDETPSYTRYDINEFKNVGKVTVTLYPKKKGDRDSFTLCDRSDVSSIKERLSKEGIWNCKVVYGPDYFNGNISPKCLTVIADKKDENKIREIGSDLGFSGNYAH